MRIALRQAKCFVEPWVNNARLWQRCIEHTEA